MKEQKMYTLAVLVDNESGVLSQVSRLFSRKGYNIESLAVGRTHRPEVSRITIEVLADDDHIILLANQLRKLYPVHSVNILKSEKSFRRELVMIKVKAPTNEVRNEIIQITNIFRGQIVDVSVGALTIALIGDENKINGIENVLSEFEVIELVRTGYVALERGLDTIYSDTKEKGEFNYGKNVL